MTTPETPERCRALVAGFGRPGMRDLDFGRQIVECLQQLEWPEGVVVEDLSCAVPLVLHRLQELRPGKVVLLGAVARDLDPPGAIRRYRVPATPPHPSDVHRSIEESVTGLVDLDHTLAVARHWGGLPADTVVIEVEPAEAGFGMGFSDVLAACIDPILDLVREEVAEVAGVSGDNHGLDPVELLGAPTAGRVAAAGREAEPSPAMVDLLRYAGDHTQARLRSSRAPAPVEETCVDVPGITVAGRSRPWGVFVENGGDWFDAVPLGDGRVGVVVGDVDGRGVEAAAAMSDLRAAVRAYAVLDGASPAALVRDLDRLASATGLGHLGRLLYLVVDPSTGEVILANAGGCPPLVLDGSSPGGHYVYSARSAPLGMSSDGDRPQAAVRLARGSTMLLFTDGLVESAAVRRGDGLQRLRQAATAAPPGLGDLCEHVLEACARDLRRDDDICLLGLRLGSVAPADQVGAGTAGSTWVRPRHADTAVRGSAASLSTNPDW